jgi:hypothetical protein
MKPRLKDSLILRKEKKRTAPLAQLAERGSYEPEVAGPNPAGSIPFMGTIKMRAYSLVAKYFPSTEKPGFRLPLGARR